MSSAGLEGRVDAELELCVAMLSLENYDLFERGPAKVFLAAGLDPKADAAAGDGGAAGAAAAEATAAPTGGSVQSKTVKVEFKGDSFALDNALRLRMQVPIRDDDLLEEQLGLLTATAKLELLFHQTDSAKLAKVDSKALSIGQYALPGLHYAAPLTFGFFHTAVVNVSISSCLVGFFLNGRPGELPQKSVRSKRSKSSSGGFNTPMAKPRKSRWPWKHASSASYEVTPELPRVRGGQFRRTAGSLKALVTAMLRAGGDLCVKCGAAGLPEVAQTITETMDSIRAQWDATQQRLGNPDSRLDELGVAAEWTQCVAVWGGQLEGAWRSCRCRLLFDRPVFDELARWSFRDLRERQCLGYFVSTRAPGPLLGSRVERRGVAVIDAVTAVRGCELMKRLGSLRVQSLERTAHPREACVVVEDRYTIDTPISPSRFAGAGPGPETRHGTQMEAALAATGLQICDDAGVVRQAHHECASLGGRGGAGAGAQGDGSGHLIVCVHGMAGNMFDLRMVKLHMEAYLPKLSFLMSHSNQDDTHRSFDEMADNLAAEFKDHLFVHRSNIQRVSFIGHSLGNIIIRTMLARPDVQALFGNIVPRARSGAAATGGAGAAAAPAAAAAATPPPHAVDQWPEGVVKPTLHTLLSLCGPHLGALYLNGLVGTGMWVMKRWKSSASLEQLALAETTDPRQSHLYRLSQSPCFEFFQNVLFVASPQDKYAPLSSALVHVSSQSQRDRKLGAVYQEMVQQLMEPLAANPGINVARLYLLLPPTAPKNLNTMIGRAGHIALLDDEHTIDKLFVGAIRYFF